MNGLHYDLMDPDNVLFVKLGEGTNKLLSAQFESVPDSGGAYWLVPDEPLEPGSEYALTTSRTDPNNGIVFESDLTSFEVDSTPDTTAPTFEGVQVSPRLEFVGDEGCQAEMISFRVLGWSDQFATYNYVGVLAELRKGSKRLNVMGWMSPLSGGGAIQSELYFSGCPIPKTSKGMNNLSFGGEVDLTLRFYDWAGNLSAPYSTKYVLPEPRSGCALSANAAPSESVFAMMLLLALWMARRSVQNRRPLQRRQ